MLILTNQSKLVTLFFLPHHPVIRGDKQATEVRIVYDASVKSTGPVLNDCLPSGPSLLSDIPDVLMRFRYHRVALAADIVKAFLVVRKLTKMFCVFFE